VIGRRLRVFTVAGASIAALTVFPFAVAQVPTAAQAAVEVQVNVCGAPAEVVPALAPGIRPQRRDVWYFDTRDLALLERGAVFRLRIESDRAELTLKAARQECAAVPRELLPHGDAKCELDLHGGAMRGAVSISRRLRANEAAALTAGRSALATALNEAQVRFLRERLQAWPLPADVVALGPVALRGYRSAKSRDTLEVWTLPDGTSTLEISQKTDAVHVAKVHEALLARLARAGVAACADQSSRAEDKLRTLVR
jgi:hypothetical protein